jgi:hypothetical protein
MHAFARRQILFMRLGGAVLPVALIAYLVLSRTSVDPRIISVILVGGMLVAVTMMVGSVLLYHRRASRQLRILLQAAIETEG